MTKIINILTNSVASGTTSGTSSGAGESNYFMWILLALVAAFLIISMVMSSKQNKKRQKEAEERLNGMAIGDNVKTIGGICGTVVQINNDENTFVLATGKNGENCVKFDKVAVYQIEHPVKFEESETIPAQPETETTTETDENAPTQE